MTTGRSDLSGKNRGILVTIYEKDAAKVESQNYIKIVRILGYK
jgi:hypothetical protein